MNYSEVLEYLYSRLPVFTRDGASAIKKDLTNTLALCNAVGNPQHRFRSVHVAGTNGKGSSSHALAAIFQAAGYRTGLYTSPHLVDFRERIRIDGEMVSQQFVAEFINTHRVTIESVRPSFFEVTVALAFDYFAKRKVDIAIIETGLGGRLDSTNIILPELSLITNIGMDHADILGNTLEEIAKEKAGIMKPSVPVVISEHQTKVADVFIEHAQYVGAPLEFADQARKIEQVGRDINGQVLRVYQRGGASQEYRLDLQGTYQAKNLLGVLGAVAQLRRLGWNLPDLAVKDALSQVQQLTGLRGRWEVLRRDPLVVVDTGHNEDGWRVVLENIRLTNYDCLHLVIGVMKDKDLAKMLPMLPKDASYYFCQVEMPRALPSGTLREAAAQLDLSGEAYPSVAEALMASLREAKKSDLIFVGGSTFVVGELLGSSDLGTLGITSDNR